MTLPNFLTIGTQKAGTTLLGRQLGRHPDVVCYPEEILAFDKKCSRARGVDWYRSLTAGAESFAATGEKTLGYMRANGHGVPAWRAAP